MLKLKRTVSAILLILSLSLTALVGCVKVGDSDEEPQVEAGSGETQVEINK